MAVQTFNPTDLSQSTANWAVAQRIVGPFAPHAQVTPNLTLALDPGHLLSGTTLTEVNAQNVGPFAPPASGFRIDRVVIDRATGVASIVTGIADSLTPPAIPVGTLPVAQVFLQNTTTAISNHNLVDERSFYDQTTAARPIIATRAHRNGVGQSGITSNVWAKVELSATDFNVGDAFDTSTSRFQPAKAGYYLLHGQVMMNCNIGGSLYAGLFINGGIIVQCRALTPISTLTYAAATTIAHFNGSTDYAELHVLNTIVTNGVLDGTSVATFFTASLLS
ncbi:hypothetical protein J2847_000139 [Azospirillum agricola]|uniref:hypothetical protein n=1 Tax=Azospirillum agricola TaxID=1720247 RepID=UPI001AEA237F|nr:hypothetical protein [Azospirillum agricola]MBP2226872.1 hypothetical protein [Azospirillum agricola]